MPKAEAGSAKAVANAMKARGLTKLRFYCQVCSKPCRDANAYNNHINSEAHMRRIEALTSSGNPNKIVDSFSDEFQREYVRLLSRRFGTRRINANQVYQEYIADRHHLHMNATKWVTLSEFVKHLGREGIVHVEETEQGWYISWIDNSPEALARQDALQKMNRAKVDDEQRSRKLLQEQIERAEREKAAAGGSAGDVGPKVEEGLKRDGNAPLKIGISLASSSKKATADCETASAATAASSSSGSAEAPVAASPSATAPATSAASASATPAFRMGFNPLKQASKASSSAPAAAAAPRAFGVNPLKAASSSSTAAGEKKKSKPPSSMTMAEKIMMEDMERKKRKAESGRIAGPTMQQNVKRSRF
ncbi:uncharacterized protein PFL1_01041 [Pseudozyma flocculosa PF-1]|uniref:Related to RTS2 - Basic zinc-finger protein, involved in UV response and DNA replication n=1 Tax=Pseudozyma flocculosa TaxID=84751 RepID=A0A5C3F9R1_9BASI|nr:uncharacterized protein PFL1_01041 [Pseudozyma flocculosa PF-1]EPQ31708.1 hypothetical protein PFL1_01041 [Pseudozyma flocculosa PF-1]SPO40826.1 related to RTS2 - Basic zinc-finger protein, involved in UV response and DNA replication [Pseudozyma flocculosa]